MIWWTKSWNPVIGCTKCSPACDNCYAERLHNQRHRALLAGRRCRTATGVRSTCRVL